MLNYQEKKTHIFKSLFKADAHRLQIKPRDDAIILRDAFDKSFHSFVSPAVPNLSENNCYNCPLKVELDNACLDVNKIFSKQQSKILGSYVLTSVWWVSMHFCARLQLDKLTGTQNSFQSLPPWLSVCLTAHTALLFMSSSETGSANFLQLNKESVPSLCFLYCKCWNSYRDLVASSVKTVWREKKEKDFWILKKLLTAVVQRSAHIIYCDKCAALSTSLPAWNSVLHSFHRHH